MNNKEIDEEYRRKVKEWHDEELQQRQEEDLYRLVSRGCMIIILFVVMLAVIALACLFSSCSKLERQSPVKVVYKQRIESNSQYSVYKVTSYEMKETHYDTVKK